MERIFGKGNVFLDEVKKFQNCSIPELRELVSRFLSKVEEGKVTIDEQPIIDIRSISWSRDGTVAIFVPDDFSAGWWEEKHNRMVILGFMKAVSELEGLTGPQLAKFEELKEGIVAQL